MSKKIIDIFGYELAMPDEVHALDLISVEIVFIDKDKNSSHIKVNVQAECGCTSLEFVEEFNRLKNEEKS